jgi:hypothetical protein
MEPSLSEEQAVAQRNKSLEARFAKRRCRAWILALVFGIAAIALAAASVWALAIASLFLAFICVSDYFAANGHLHHVRRRSQLHTKLSRDFSILDREEGNRPKSGVATPSH